jgi:hypothetical protein
MRFVCFDFAEVLGGAGRGGMEVAVLLVVCGDFEDGINDEDSWELVKSNDDEEQGRIR